MGPSPLWVLLAMIPMAASVPQLHIDLVVIPHMGAQHHPAEFDAIKKAVSEIFSTVFDMGPQFGAVLIKSRAVMMFNGQTTAAGNVYVWKLSDLINDTTTLGWYTSVIQSFSSNVQYDKSLGKAFGIAREMFNKHQSQNIPVILVVTYPADKTIEITESDKSIFDETRKHGIHTYAVYKLKDGETLQTNALTSVTGDKENIYTTSSFTDDFSKTTVFDWLKNKLIGVSLCGYTERCFFQDPARKECKKAPYTPNMTANDGDCANFGKPAPTATKDACDVDKCNITCNDLWPSEKVQCDDSNCGKNTSHKLNRWVQLEHCDRQLKCPECTTTTTTAGTTTTTTHDHNHDHNHGSGGMRDQFEIVMIVVAVGIAMVG